MNDTDLAKVLEDFTAAMKARQRLFAAYIPEEPVPLGNGLALVFRQNTEAGDA